MPSEPRRADATGAGLLRVLLSAQPPDERSAFALPLALALTLHGLLAIGIALASPLGGSWRPEAAGEGQEGEQTVTLLLPGAPRATSAPAAPARPTRRTRSAPVLSLPAGMPTEVPGIAPPTVPAVTSPAPPPSGAGGFGRGPPVMSRRG